MFTIEIRFCGEWSLAKRCIKPMEDRAAFCNMAESLEMFQAQQNKWWWKLRLIGPDGRTIRNGR